MKTLPDYLRKGMKLVIVGCNPTESSVRAGHYYAGHGNPFWPTLYESGVVPEPFDYPDDRRIIEFGIGLTDLVKRPTKTIEELKREDFAEGRIVLSQKLGRICSTCGGIQWKIYLRTICPAQMQLRIAEGLALRGTGFCAAVDGRTGSAHKAECIKHFRKLAQLVVRSEKTPATPSR